MDSELQAHLGWWQDYFRRLDMHTETTAIVPAIQLAAATEPTQALFLQALDAIASCPEGSPICSVWRDLRAWGEHRGLDAPPASAFPWKQGS